MKLYKLLRVELVIANLVVRLHAYIEVGALATLKCRLL